jgi:hypothetical protein
MRIDVRLRESGWRDTIGGQIEPDSMLAETERVGLGNVKKSMFLGAWSFDGTLPCL